MKQLNNDLRKLQLTQLEILKIIDAFCKKNNIKYSLYAGTLLGAVRHKGFIPWDDDLDICMERTEYEKFVRIWEKTGPEGYILQNKENEPAFTQSFTKIRKDHTTFLQQGEDIRKYHTGIFVDVFPIDRIPTNIVKKRIFLFHCMLYQLYTREFIPKESSVIVKFFTAVILKLSSKEKRKQKRKKLLNKITRYNTNYAFNTIGIETIASLKHPFSCDMLNSYIFLQFEDSEFMCFKKWDEHLKCKFGDYMQLPPEEERVWKHHPVLLDFNRNYEEIMS